MTMSRTLQKKKAADDNSPRKTLSSGERGITPDACRVTDDQVRNGCRLGDFQIQFPVEEYRRIYRHEIKTLWHEVEEFRVRCQKEIERQNELLLDHTKRCEQRKAEDNKDIKRAPDISDKDYSRELKELETSMKTLQEKQRLLNREQQLLEKEEQLSKRQEKLKQYERDIEEAEVMLDKRQNLAHRRSQEVEILNHDLLTLKHDLEETIRSSENDLDTADSINTADDMSSDQTKHSSPMSPETSSKARRNWQLARIHLIDKVTLLETTICRYRTQVASATATITAKEMIIAREKKKAEVLQEEIQLKDKRIKNLESKLALAVEEKTRSDRKLNMLLEELQTIELQNVDTRETSRSLTSSPSKALKPMKKKLMKKQHSVFSFFHHSQDGDKNSSAGLLRNRTWGDKNNVKSKHEEKDLVEDNMSGVGEISHKENNDQEELDGQQNDGIEQEINGNARSLEFYPEDFGSKACLLM